MPFSDTESLSANTILGLIACLDLTSLESTDTPQKVESICQKVNSLKETARVAAVCFYPVFARQAKDILMDAGVKVAVVAAGFPHGQTALSVKLAEIRYAIEEGAEEIDVVINRSLLLAGKRDELRRELEEMRNACASGCLKVILETGELKEVASIAMASRMALEAGADFIKTSTGKSAVGATPEAVMVMAKELKEFYNATGKRKGIKLSGGISTIEVATAYISMVEQELGSEWMTPSLFRIGTSRLANELLNNYGHITGNKEYNNYF